MYNGVNVIVRGHKKLVAFGGIALGTSAGLVTCAIVMAFAGAPASDFSLQVTPSPLVTTVKPGQPTDLDLKVQNNGTGTEELKIEPRKFTVDKQTGKVDLDDSAPSEINPWISFSSPRFTIKPGDWITEKIHIALPKETGYSYSLALIISRTNNPQTIQSGRLIKGSLAVFTLINVDRPGATKKIEVTDFRPTQSLYEFLPAEFNISFKNTGNTIVQPYGNVFIQRGSNDATPIATLPVNDRHGYLLPDSPRTMITDWNTGFPHFNTTIDSSGKEHRDLVWDWSKLTDFRIGPYTAKLVAIYNDGQRDVPIEREVTFLVIPWRSILILTFVISLFVYLRHKQIQRNTRRAVRRALDERDKIQAQAGHDSK
ncbi:MAG TPA: hypothetical protein VMT96_01160 [Candidatus Bathyarchaeia archaeon]|nr:hypothetical protein [Candidatus Bathyarchaeia archaeon]